MVGRMVFLHRGVDGQVERKRSIEEWTSGERFVLSATEISPPDRAGAAGPCPGKRDVARMFPVCFTF